ncbi:MAG TPA: hypothetical protein VFT42_09665 [Solirubrobacteraceae bacterium]|nr:hypothetical protein [Solirubrobacteraceae bacterium]
MRTLSRPGFEWPPAERLPQHVQDAMAAKEAGRELAPHEVEALVDLTGWAFNGVSVEHEQFEERFAAWSHEATARHARRLVQR